MHIFASYIKLQKYEKILNTEWFYFLVIRHFDCSEAEWRPELCESIHLR